MKKPSVVVSYNEVVSGFDRSDQMVKTHKSMGKFVNWYKETFLYIVDMCERVVNSHLIWQMFSGVGHGMTFRNLLFREMIEILDLP